jgi:regulatory factor X, other
MMQQQFFSLSPMAGQESFGNPLDVRPGMMAHTPTTSSMLAALQADTFGTSLDPTSSSFGSDAFATMTFVDHAGTPDDSLALGSSGLSFPDYASGFDVSGFTHPDLGIGASGTPPPPSEPDSEPETKSETGHS